MKLYFNSYFSKVLQFLVIYLLVRIKEIAFKDIKKDM